MTGRKEGNGRNGGNASSEQGRQLSNVQNMFVRSEDEMCNTWLTCLSTWVTGGYHQLVVQLVSKWVNLLNFTRQTHAHAYNQRIKTSAKRIAKVILTILNGINNTTILEYCRTTFKLRNYYRVNWTLWTVSRTRVTSVSEVTTEGGIEMRLLLLLLLLCLLNCSMAINRWWRRWLGRHMGLNSCYMVSHFKQLISIFILLLVANW